MKNIKFCIEDFAEANDPEMCMHWAEEFANNDFGLAEEIDDIEGTINNEKLCELGSSYEVSQMHHENIMNLVAYLK